MASLEIEGFESLEDAFRRITEIPWEVTEKALDEMAAVAMSEIRAQGESMGVRDPESDVHILDKIVRKRAEETASGGEEKISFQGTRTRHGRKTRNAEIAFINEYGKRGQEARPFIGLAMTENEDRITGQAERVIGDWIESEFSR